MAINYKSCISGITTLLRTRPPRLFGQHMSWRLTANFGHRYTVTLHSRSLNVSTNSHTEKPKCVKCQKNDRLLTCYQNTRHKTLFHTSSNSYSNNDQADLQKLKVVLGGKIGLNWDYIIDPKNKDAMKQNISNRKGVGNIEKLHQLVELYTIKNQQEEYLDSIRKQLEELALDLPNTSHPAVPIGDESCAVTRQTVSDIPDFEFEPRTVVQLGEHLDVLRVRDVSLTTGDSTFYLKGAFARLQQALTRYTLDVLRQKGFRLLSVPDLLYPEVIEGCGFRTTGQNQVYKLKPEVYGRVCLSGTGEMPLAGFCMNQVNDLAELPLRLMTVSQCYRAEASNVEEERGIYRVHHFTKVEMFGLTADKTGTESQQLLDEFIAIQIDLFKPLGLTFRVLDMPTHELGAPANRKYDIEAWMPGKGFWGEISSASNCTDYQSRRLESRYEDGSGAQKYCHTVNGTACAVPRMIMAIAETHQNKDHTISIPTVLQPYMGGQTVISPAQHPDVTKLIKFTKTLKKAMKK